MASSEGSRTDGGAIPSILDKLNLLRGMRRRKLKRLTRTFSYARQEALVIAKLSPYTLQPNEIRSIVKAIYRWDVYSYKTSQITFIIYIIVLCMPVFYLFPGALGHELDGSVDGLSLWIYYFMVMALSWLMSVRQDATPAHMRQWHRTSDSVALAEFARTRTYAFTFVLLALGWKSFSEARLLSRPEILEAALQAITFGIGAAIVIVVVSPFSDRRVNVWRIPDTAIVAALVNALFAFRQAVHQRSDSGRHGRAAAVEIASGATIMEHIQSRSLFASQANQDSDPWKKLRQRAGTLRTLAAEAATGAACKRGHVQQSIAQAIAAAATGEWDRLPNLQFTVPVSEAHFHRRPRRALLRWFVSAVLPAGGVVAFLLLAPGQGWALSEQAQALLGQGAFLWFAIQTNSAVDPAGYHQKLSLLTNSGGSVFGWGKGKT